MKGQAQAISFVTAAIFVAVAVLIGTVVFGTVGNVVPHDRTINNESICTSSCTPNTQIEFANVPVINDSTMICFNDSTSLMARGGSTPENTSLGYDIQHAQYINLSRVGDAPSHYKDVVCTYTFDEANANEQSFFDNTTSTAYSGFILAAVIVIVLAAVGVMAVVLLIRG